MRHRFRALLGLVLAAACSHAPEAPPGPKNRLLLVGWDGASFRHIDPLLAAGKLPHLAALMDRGVRAPLASTVVPISAAAWVAAATGKGAGANGVFSFFEPVPGSYELALVSARSNRAAPLWRLLTARGQASLVFGVPLTYPPEPILGTMVCGMLAPAEATYTWPPELTPELRARGFDPDVEPWLDEDEATRAELLAQLDLRRAVLGELLAAKPWRLAWVVFKEVDVAAHGSYELDLAETVAPVYEALDRALGELVAAVGADTDVLVLSDHGFQAYTYGLNLHEWLVQNGFAARKPGRAPAELPNGPLARRGAAEHALLLDELDLAATRAFAWTCEGHFGSVRLNLAGREPEGCVRPEDAEGVLAELERRLAADPMVVRTGRASALLPGDERAALPELLFETRDDVQVFAEVGAPLTGRYPHPLPDHDGVGILVAAGPSFRHGRVEAGPKLVDIAPTALYLLGEPVPREMQGAVLRELLTLERPVTSVPEAELVGILPAPAPGEAYTPEEIAELRRRLSALGYGQ